MNCNHQIYIKMIISKAMNIIMKENLLMATNMELEDCIFQMVVITMGNGDLI